MLFCNLLCYFHYLQYNHVLHLYIIKSGFLNNYYKTNVMGTLNMLGLAKRIGARFLLTSTSEVYGDPLEHPQKETYWGHVNPIGTTLYNLLVLVSPLHLDLQLTKP